MVVLWWWWYCGGDGRGGERVVAEEWWWKSESLGTTVEHLFVPRCTLLSFVRRFVGPEMK